MKKITLICIREHREATLMALQELGALHLEPIQKADSELLDDARARWLNIRRAGEVLDHYDKSGTAAPTDPKRTAQSVVDEILKLLTRRNDYTESREYWMSRIAQIEPFGSFDPEGVQALQKRGIQVRLFKAGTKEIVEVPRDAVYTEYLRDKSGVYFSLVSRDAPDVPYEKVPLPERSLKAMRRMVTELDASLVANEEALRALTGYLPDVREIVNQAEDRVYFLEAQDGMGEADTLCYLRGYCPERNVSEIRKAARLFGWGLLVEDASDTDRPPTKIESPRWVEPIRTVFGFIGVVPGYHEADISAIFLLFLSLFFGIIVGDAGYGLLFLVGTLIAQRKFRSAPASIFHLLYITSSATILWGALTGNYFGYAGVLPGLLAPLKINWLTDTRNLMLLCFFIGAVHLTIAHIWNALRIMNSLKALAEMGWICIVWTMYFAARFLVLSIPFPPIMAVIGGVGLILLVLFITPFKHLKTEWFNHVMLPLNLLNNFVDVVSYVRLFAVGTATLAVATAFNDMGMNMASGHWALGLVGALVIFVGHTLNILLAAMGVLVHGIRLNTLEFAGHMGLEWTGIPYQPFVRKSARGPLHDDVIEPIK